MSLVNNRQFRPARPIRFINAEFQFPAFEFTYPEWAGASYALGTLAAAPGFNYTFKPPATAPNESFVAVIRYNSGTTYFRWRLWDNENAMIPFDLYRGEKIYNSLSPVLEIWNVQGTLTAAVADAWTLTMGLLVTPTSITDITPTIYTSL